MTNKEHLQTLLSQLRKMVWSDLATHGQDVVIASIFKGYYEEIGNIKKWIEENIK